MTTVIEPSRRERKKSAVRSKIIAAAIELFSRKGIENATVEQIAEAADIGKGTVYNYFETKEDIVVAFMADLERRVQARLHRLAALTGPLDSILAEFIRLQLQRKKRYHKFVRVFLGQMFLHTDSFMPYMAEMQKAIDPPMEKLFRALQQRGLLRQDVNLSELILIFKTMQLGLTALWAVEGPPFRGTEYILTQEIKLFCEGLKETT
ncbi:MAG TPA: TetR/AcrR family transcriptional regulator [Bryobacteraceae bacterium]|nr:TetR/AcrR family transcriptional regulator [Bryobacteraceae bacterium]